MRLGKIALSAAVVVAGLVAPRGRGHRRTHRRTAEGGHRRRLRRRRRHGRPHRHRGRPRRAAPRRQRGRRRGRRRRHARRHRAVLRRHRRRRLLRLLRRPHRQGAHHRRPRGRARRDDRGHLRRPGRPACRTPSRRPGSAASPSACPARSPPGRQRAAQVGHAVAGAACCSPAARVADRGFTVDADVPTSRSPTTPPRSGSSTSTSELYLPGGAPPAVGSTLRNPDLADTYRLIARRGTDAFYRGAIARDIVRTVQHPPVADDPTGAWPYPIRPGGMTLADLAGYDVRFPGADPRPATAASTSTAWRRRPAAAPPSARRSTSSRRSDLAGLDRDAGAAPLPRGERARVRRPQPVRRRRHRRGRCSTSCSATGSPPSGPARSTRARRCTKPVAAGRPGRPRRRCPTGRRRRGVDAGQSTTNLTVADRWGNVVEYTLTIEQTGGNAMVVPGRGFLLNNELTDFNFTPHAGHRARPEPARPGQAAAQLDVADDRARRRQAVPGARLARRLDDHHDRAADPGQPHRPRHDPARGDRRAARVAAQHRRRSRPSRRSSTAVRAGLAALGHSLRADAPEIGAATAIEFGRPGRLIAAAEPARRGGGAAAVLRPI